jgi:hypothetical protein
MVSERERGNSDSYIGEGNTANKLYTKHRQANKRTLQMDSNMKAFYCQANFTAEIRSRRLACWDSHTEGHQNCYQIFGRRNTQRRYSEENVGEKS